MQRTDSEFEAARLEQLLAQLREPESPLGPCPSEDELSAYALGLSDDRAVHAHLSCGHCRAIVSSLSEALGELLHTRQGSEHLLQVQRRLLASDELRQSSKSQSVPSFSARELLAGIQWAGDRFQRADLRTAVVERLEQRGFRDVVLRRPDAANSSWQIVAASQCDVASVAARSWFGRRTGLAPRERQAFSECSVQRRGDRLIFPLILIRSRVDCSVRPEPCAWLREGNCWKPVVSQPYQLQVVGTLSLTLPELSTEAQVAEVGEFVTRIAAPEAHRASLLGLCEKVLDLTLNYAGAKHGALHLGRDVDAVFSGRHAVLLQHRRGVDLGPCESGGVGAPPRRDGGGIGSEAMLRGRIVHVAGAELLRRNARLFAMGIRSTTAVPLFTAERLCIGVMYLHYESETPAPDLRTLAEAAGKTLGSAQQRSGDALLCVPGQSSVRANSARRATGVAAAHLGIVRPAASGARLEGATGMPA